MDAIMMNPTELIIELYFVNIRANATVIISTNTIITITTFFFISLNLLY